MNTQIDRYELRIWWSDEDQCFLAEMADLPGCMADGSTREETIKNILVIAAEWIETARSLGRAIPEPTRHLSIA